MSEKKWSIKYRDHSFRGKSGKKGGSQFPRHAMNLYEGTHLGMRKKCYTKSRMGAGWNYGGAGLNSKYIVGLLNKFVGRSYDDFKQVFDNKLKQFKKYDLHWCRLEDYLHDEPKTCYWKQEFYIDDNNNIQRCKLIARHNMWGPKLTKKQERFNEKVKIPNLGVCREDSHYPVKKGYWGRYEDESSTMALRKHNKRYPVLLGTFWVIVNKKVLKLPVYTYNADYNIEYFNYQESHYDYNLHKYVTQPFEDYVPYYAKRDEAIQKKRRQVVKDWIPVRTKISSKTAGQDYWITTDNPKLSDCIRNIHNYETLIKENPESDDVELWKDRLQKYKEEADKLDPKVHLNMGYGKFYLFVKKSDYEREIERLVEKSESRQISTLL